MSLAGLLSKGDYESRQKVEKKENERKKKHINPNSPIFNAFRIWRYSNKTRRRK